MRFFGWFRGAAQPAEASEANAPRRRWAWLGGRRILTNTPYVFPKDVAEGGRLDLQHHLLKVAAGKNYRAPIRQPRAILDVACGTGIWCREMALEFKQAQVIGFDIDRTPMEGSLAQLGPGGMFPSNFRFMEADALKPFPFENEQFDFTHARFISPFLPIERWPQVVSEMVRVTREGGYVELVDVEFPSSQSQAFMFLREAIKRVFEMRGLDTNAAGHLADYLRQAGLARVQERHFVVGTGGDKQRQQRLLVADGLAVLTNLHAVVVKAGVLSEADYSANLERAREELPRIGATLPVTFAFSIKV